MIQFFYKIAKDEMMSTLSEPREGCWIHAEEATHEDIAEIGRIAGIEALDLQDTLDKYEIPRIEKVKNDVFIFTRFPADQETGLYTSTLAFILTPHYFITIAPQKCPVVRQILQQKSRLSLSQKSKLLLHILLKINQEFTAQIRRVRYNILSAEKEMIHVESEDITALTKNEEIFNQYLASLGPIRHVLEAIHSGRYTNFYEKDQELLEDLLNAVKQSEELCSTVLKSIRSLRDSYQIIFANNLHKTIKLLTGLTIILNIPTILASIYGMNVTIPIAKYTYSFFGVISVTVVL